MHELHVAAGAGAFVAGELVVYTAETLVAVVLLALTLRALRLPGASGANVIFAACAVLWSGGSLVYLAAIAAGTPRGSTLARIAEAVPFAGAAAFPIAMLAAWRPFAARAGKQRTLRILEYWARISAAAIVLLLLYESLFRAGPGLIMPEHFTAVNATILLSLGAAVSLRRPFTPHAVYVPSLVIIGAVSGAAVLVPVAIHGLFPRHLGAMLPAIGSHALLVAMVCAFFLFARFRYADVFIRYSVRILMAAGMALVLAYVARWIIMAQDAGHAAMTPTVHVFGITILTASLMLAFAFADAPVTKVINQWLFRSPDYRAHARQLGEALRGLETEAEIASEVENATRQIMTLDNMRLVPVEALSPREWPEDAMHGETVEIGPSDPLQAGLPIANVEFLVPVDSAGQVTHLLLISPGPNRPALVTQDLNHLRTVAAQCGNRLDALRRERENVERRSREAVLLQQVTEAELRALRSQVNPHFLFNSLNTIADLIVKEPARAEEMTLRLADVFRHVLAHSSLALVTVKEEIEFLRAYLYIEEVRFRDRLQVEIDVAPECEGERIPSLILQPLVENALKHGLAPKPGAGHLWISARFEGERLCLRIEDDGLGLSAGASESSGLGLRNTAERLQTSYRGAASISLEPRAPSGTRVTLLIPRGESGSAS